MFLTGRSGYRGTGQFAEGSFLALFSHTAGGEIRACVRYVKMRQIGHFMSGNLYVKSDRAKAVNDPGPPAFYPPTTWTPYIKDGEYRIYVEGTYGDNGLTIDVTKYPGLWEILHPLPVELTVMKWKDTQGWNSAGSEGPSIKQWATNNIKALRRPFMGDIDLSDKARREKVQELNSNAKTREELEALYGKDNVWDVQEMQRDFDVSGFLAPYVGVTRKSDGKPGVLSFQHHPRFYWGFQSR